MKTVKVKLLKKLKTIGHRKRERIMRLRASDGYIPASPPPPATDPLSPPVPIFFQGEEEEPRSTLQSLVKDQEPEIIEVSELMKDLEDEEMEFLDDVEDKENIRPSPEANRLENLSLMKAKIESLTKWDSGFFPFSEIDSIEEEEGKDEPPAKVRKMEGKAISLLDFEEKCPPGGSDSVIVYTTGLRGVPKTYEDCQNMILLLENFRVLFFERDILIHSEFKEELWRMLGQENKMKLIPPRLFIRGRYIGGAEEVFALHEQGKLRPLLEGIPLDVGQEVCGGCVGMRFILCFRCSGSRKLHLDQNHDYDCDNGNGEWKKCPECNENGLIVCPFCC
ncbi:unnamed protein product [Cuscuta epithymum]|uniref:Glutaredoxin domain-containing protein n=1 Tax=Cuscuta epithymum TaxID=186058 RepID=A0AAV0EJA0_9ASTE|nr:unnamed protein product [Cuscuta epithymum]